MELSRQQKKARRAIDRSDEQLFNLWGVAGTGKTTLAAACAADSSGSVVVATLTNKAAQVLRSKGLPQAQTIHSLLYRVTDEDDCNCAGIDKHQSWCLARRPTFVDNLDSELRGANLLILDETSMIDGATAEKLLSYGVRTLALGDPFQLPPIRGTSYFTDDCKPDYVLDEIHRQARDSPVLALASQVREGRALRPGRYGDSLVTQGHPEFDTDDWDQIIVGFNATRCHYNEIYREAIVLTPEGPKRGDKLVCKTNDQDLGLINGDLWTVVGTQSRGRGVLLRLRDEIGREVSVDAWPEGFNGLAGYRTLDAMPWRVKRQLATFYYGYAITCHSSQGSEWPGVVIRNEPPPRTDRARWLYTAITRAQDRVMVSVGNSV